jgi:hypothetical protein
MAALSINNIMGNIFYGGCFLMITGTMIMMNPEIRESKEQLTFEDVGEYIAICGIIGSGFAAFYFLLICM